uniref:Helicase ATP-binding domain-containing protein n=1 Tax=Fagus sylvatica TaxID=28930 RepID=A0A2N9GS55_FAGSY
MVAETAAVVAGTAAVVAGTAVAVWADARISSIERKPHEFNCSCQFYVNFYVNQGPLGSERGTLSKEVHMVGIDKISILQRLERLPCEDRHYRWASCMDCASLPKTKLCLGRFLSDLSWLLVTSVLKQTTFDVRSVKNKVVYQILGADDDSCTLSSGNYLNAVNFRVENDLVVPTVVKFVPAEAIEAASSCETRESVSQPFYDLMDLRRSKRRNVQPERFLGCDSGSEIDIGYVRTRPYKIDQWKDDEMSLPLSCLFGMNASCSEEQNEGEQKVHSQTLRPCEDLPVRKSKTKSKVVKSTVASQREHQTQLAIVPLPDASAPIAFEHHHYPARRHGTYKEEMTELSSKYYYMNSFPTAQKRKISGLEDVEYEGSWEGKASDRKVQGKRYHSISAKRDGHSEERTYQKRTLSAGAYKDLINSFLKKMDTTATKEEPPIIDQWKKFKETTSLNQREMEPPPEEDEGEMSETEMLWKEMELAMASSYLFEDNEGSEARVSTGFTKSSSEICQHEYKLDEEIGILCRRCGYVSTEIRDVAAPFMQYTSWNTDDKRCNQEDSAHKLDEDEGLDILHTQASSDVPLSEDSENVWALVPDLRRKLHFHQKKAFEFLWRNVAGSMVPAQMEKASKKTGGCVISHTPGAGKTFLIISFLVSYLKLFPGKRPLVLAPKTTLYTWYKEFIKWEIPIPVYLIHGRRTYRVFKQKSPSVPGVPKPTDDVMHVLDCLEKIQKWHAHPSVLVMGYTSFLTLMREDSKFAHRRYMAKVLRESPGILVLDEGHNPRSTKSRLRKVLMKVETDLRVLLSGTLFQNNFCEYFNTLCLARPKFINEVLRELDPKYKRKKKGQKALNLREARARKFFLDNIAKRIDSNVGEERMEGLNMLRNITNGFIDVYEGGGSETLPGLQIYTLLMNSTDIQHEVLVRLHRIMAQYHGYPLELELLITLGSIHPWLIKTAVCANKFFSMGELMELEKYKFDLKKGSKVRFVLNLVYRVVKNEKVLLFCHNIAPVKLFLELFENIFGWRKGREVLVLTGDLELFERGRVMDQFEEANGPSRVLLASITACAEGISLTAASRVILLDSEWNPSKTKQAIARAFRPGQQKMVYVYQLLATGTLEEDKYRRTTWKEWVSSMIFSEAFVEDPSRWQAEKIEDDILREMVEEDRHKSFHMIMKNEKASTN